MKKNQILLGIVVVIILQMVAVLGIAQTATMFNYQAVIRDNLGNPVVNEPTDILISILQEDVDGFEVFSELHEIETNAYGMVNLQIGSIEDLSLIDWSSDIYFIQVSVNDVIMGTTQLVSVPMALSANYAEHYNESDPFFESSPSYAITNAEIVNWNETHAWGDHNGLYLPNDYTPDMSGVVNTTDNQEIAGVKVFTESISVPEPLFETSAVNKAYVDLLIARIEALELVANGQVEDIDGNLYNIVTIGTQDWFVENLVTDTYNDGTPITFIDDNTTWNDADYGAFCQANHDASYKETYGNLYNWYAVGTENLCPEGWHVPTVSEWDELTNYLIDNNYGYDGGGIDINKSLSSKTLWSVTDIEGGAGFESETNNASGFTALPASFMRGIVDTPGSECYFWTSDEYDVDSPSAHKVAWTLWSTMVNQGTTAKERGFSVRCLKD